MANPPTSYAEISDELGLPIGSIGPTRGRCLARLRELLQASRSAPTAVWLPTRRATASLTGIGQSLVILSMLSLYAFWQ